MSFSFNKDGSLAVTKKHREHIPLLRAISEIPFGMGKKLLIDHLRGRENSRTKKLRLTRFSTFASLGGFQEEEIKKLIIYLENKKLIEVHKQKGLYPVYALTEKGYEELATPRLEVRINDLIKIEEEQLSIKNPFNKEIIEEITETDKKLFETLKEFFGNFNEEQKKAVICKGNKILCVAGAGSGKTSVLTKRIEFLIKYRGVNPKKILAITFTRKARKEMIIRLSKKGITEGTLAVETFNSFSEKLLKKHGNEFYGKKVRVMTNKEFITIVNEALKEENLNPETLIIKYFTKRQRIEKDLKQLYFTFLYDLQSLIERKKLSSQTFKDLRKKIPTNNKNKELANMMISIAERVDKKLKEQGLRDFTDQLIDAIRLLEKNPLLTPDYEHVLVDEYQDVNDAQIKLLELLKPKNLFAVGDPRQSIYGWRGSRVSYITGFKEQNPEAKIILLSTNYRSSKKIVSFFNEIAKKTGYEPLRAFSEEEGVVRIKQYKNKEEEASKICQEILKYEGKKKEIFVLARTNKSLKPIQELCETLKIPYLLRTEEQKKLSKEPDENQITIATIHAIKGLEAKRVYLISANNQNFPCKASDHPVLEMLSNNNDYDSYSEELRVFYVAITRAMKELLISYYGTLTYFIPRSLINNITGQSTLKKPLAKKNHEERALRTDYNMALMKLRKWRYNLAKERGCPAYVICNDKALQSLIELMPSTKEELLRVPGFGEARVNDFGEELIFILKTL